MIKLTRTLFVLGSLLSLFSVNGQSLARKGFLGVAASPDGNDPQILVVRQVVPNSTAMELGLQAGDEIQELNRQKVASQQAFLAMAAQLTEGAALQIRIRRQGKVQLRKGKVKARPLPFSADISYRLSALSFRGGLVRAVMLEPGKQEARKGTVYFIQGYPCFSMAYLPREDSYVSAMEALVQKGYRVYFVEKPGMGDSQTDRGCQSIGFDEELELFHQGYEHLIAQLPEEKNIILFGHSLGGIIAPILATRFNPAGVVVYGTVLKPWQDYLVDLLREQEPLKGVDYASAEDSLQVYRPLLHDLFVRRQSPAEIMAADPLNGPRLKASLQFNGQDQLIGRHYTYWQELNAYNMAAYWKAVKVPVLSIFGESDIAALKPGDMQRIIEIVNHYHPGNGTFLSVPGTNHDMVKTGTMKENLQVQFSPAYFKLQKEKFNYPLMDQIGSWMSSLP